MGSLHDAPFRLHFNTIAKGGTPACVGPTDGDDDPHFDVGRGCLPSSGKEVPVDKSRWKESCKQRVGQVPIIRKVWTLWFGV